MILLFRLFNSLLRVVSIFSAFSHSNLEMVEEELVLCLHFYTSHLHLWLSVVIE